MSFTHFWGKKKNRKKRSYELGVHCSVYMKSKKRNRASTRIFWGTDWKKYRGILGNGNFLNHDDTYTAVYITQKSNEHHT